MHSFVRSFIHSFIHWQFIHSFFQLATRTERHTINSPATLPPIFLSCRVCITSNLISIDVSILLLDLDLIRLINPMHQRNPMYRVYIYIEYICTCTYIVFLLDVPYLPCFVRLQWWNPSTAWFPDALAPGQIFQRLYREKFDREKRMEQLRAANARMLVISKTWRGGFGSGAIKSRWSCSWKLLEYCENGNSKAWSWQQFNFSVMLWFWDQTVNSCWITFLVIIVSKAVKSSWLLVSFSNVSPLLLFGCTNISHSGCKSFPAACRRQTPLESRNILLKQPGCN